MKDSAKYAGKLKKLCTKLSKTYKVDDTPATNTPTEVLIIACLNSVTTESKALSAYKKLINAFTDFNDLRVCRTIEIVDIIGKSFPKSNEVASRITGTLNDIYARNHTVTLENLNEGGKREAKAFLESLPSSNHYINSLIMMKSLGAHAFPLCEPMLDMLRGEKVVNPTAKIDDVQGFLERQISSTNLHAIYSVIRQHSDEFKPKPPVKKKVAKKTTKKKAAKKKTVAKKTDNKTVKAAKKKTTKTTSKKKTTKKKTTGK